MIGTTRSEKVTRFSDMSQKQGNRNMTSAEFGTWLRGFMDAAGDTLTQEQCAKIAEQAKQIYDPPLVYPSTLWDGLQYPSTNPWPTVTYRTQTSGYADCQSYNA